MTSEAKAILERLKLEPLPEEGGYFRRIYSDDFYIDENSLPDDFKSPRRLLTGIYFLLTTESFSKLHRLPNRETYHFHGGDPVEMLQLLPDGTGKVIELGDAIHQGQQPVVFIPPNTWQGSRIKEGHANHGYSLFSVTVVPGFEWEDFQLCNRLELSEAYPQFAGLLDRFV